jgi:hypothetical protein
MLAGELQPLGLRAESSGRFTAAQGGGVIEWHGRGDYRDSAGSGEVDAAQGRANTLRARLDVGARGVLTGSFDAAVADPTALGFGPASVTVSALKRTLSFGKRLML